jgi:hypothetical protein
MRRDDGGAHKKVEFWLHIELNFTFRTLVDFALSGAKQSSGLMPSPRLQQIAPAVLGHEILVF